jgi:hypothetical protein
MFASTLMFSVIAPSLSYAAYFVDQTKSWALETRAKEVMDKVTRHKVGAGIKRRFQGAKPWILWHWQHVSARSEF